MQQSGRVCNAAVQIRLQVCQRVPGRDPGFVQPRWAQLQAAGDRDYRYVRSRRRPRYANRRLACQRLFIERSLTSHHQVGTGDPAVEVDQVQDQLDARLDLGVKQSQRGEAGATSGASPGTFSVIASGRVRDQLRPVPQ
jgi:hypothetical protein